MAQDNSSEEIYKFLVLSHNIRNHFLTRFSCLKDKKNAVHHLTITLQMPSVHCAAGDF